MSASRLPKTDSIEELARFWDSHDVTDFADELEEVAEPVFDREATFAVRLEPDKVEAVEQVAKAQGYPVSKLIQLWVDEKINAIRLDQTS